MRRRSRLSRSPNAAGPLRRPDHWAAGDDRDRLAVDITRRKGWLVPESLRLAEGRALAWYEYGDAAGLPCVYTTGTPASGLAGATYDKAAAEAGVRWISVDKPG